MTMPANTRQTARTITEQTGWKRPMPMSICQDVDVLLRVTKYSFDIFNLEFVRYFTARTGIVLDDNHPEIVRRRALGLLLTPVAPLADQQQWISNGNCNDNRSLKIIRGKLQDCWELFTAQNPQPAQPAGQLNLF